jgi:hypothetical protein
LDAGFGEPLSEPDRGLLRSSISLVDNILQIQHALDTVCVGAGIDNGQFDGSIPFTTAAGNPPASRTR